LKASRLLVMISLMMAAACASAPAQTASVSNPPANVNSPDTDAATPIPTLQVAGVKTGTPEEICTSAEPAPEPAGRNFGQAEQVTQADVDYRAIFCTDAGPVYIDLFEKDTPVTVNNFVFLAINGFYNNTTFHRVLQGFMAQGGDPTGTGAGGPGYRFQDEFVKGLTFEQPGRLAMANSGPGTNGSQFFITTVPTPHLNGAHTIFGQVIQGQANVEKIQLRDPERATQPGEALKTVVIITDPLTVQTREVTQTAKADVVAAFDRVNALVSSGGGGLENSKVVLTTDEVVQNAPEALREQLDALLRQHHHQYRISTTITNKTCDLQSSPLVSAQYTLDSFDSSEDAAAVLADKTLMELPLENGFTDSQPSESLKYPVFTAKVTACDQAAVHGMTYLQRGAFIATVETTISANSNGASALDQVLDNAVAQQIFESLFTDILYPEIR
jgi:cyclophilin family peptidyl-prolyl cis-trans isomerase